MDQSKTTLISRQRKLREKSDCNDGLDYFNTQNFISIYIALLETKINHYYIFHNRVGVIAALASKKQPS